MWATYNYDNLPTVNVSISGVIENDEDFNRFIQEWLSLFTKGEDFNFYFGNGSFEKGDAEIYYQIIRYFKPKKNTGGKSIPHW